MKPQETYELRIVPFSQAAKDRAVELIRVLGFESYVEACLDELDIEHEFGRVSTEEEFQQNGGEMAPLSVYRYDPRALSVLQSLIALDDLSAELSCDLRKFSTETWTEGWKQSFLPVGTTRFFVYPPWIKPDEAGDRIRICIEPAMAFGTGQHETTQLCLKMIEKFEREVCQASKILDVGTGTGILAIAAAKLNPTAEILGSDLDPDAIIAARRNASANLVGKISFEVGSVLSQGDRGSTIIFANILAPVLVELMPDLARALDLGSKLLLSGLLDEQRDWVLAATQECGLRLIESLSQNDWCALWLEKPRT